MSRFRKKPVVIEAAQWNRPGDEREIGAPVLTMTTAGGRSYIETLEGPQFINLGDWIIKGIYGDFSSCEPADFATIYEPADAPPVEMVRILRVLEYSGPRASVEKQVSLSVHGQREGVRGCTIKVATLGEFPEILSNLADDSFANYPKES